MPASYIAARTGTREVVWAIPNAAARGSIMKLALLSVAAVLWCWSAALASEHEQLADFGEGRG